MNKEYEVLALRFRLGELFCGPGGMGLGAKLAGCNSSNDTGLTICHEWANDIDHWSCETYKHNVAEEGKTLVIEKDVRELDIQALPPIDGFSFGFPCNDFSVVGEQKGIQGQYGPLYRYGVEVMEYHNPQWFVAENVSGLSSADSGKTLERILKDFSGAGRGYVLTSHLYKFEHYGVPQARHRIIIVGIRRDLGLTFRVPAPTTQYNPVTVREAIENPPIAPETPNQEITRHAPRVVEMLNYIAPGENAWSENIPERLRLNVKKARLSQIYKRLDPTKPAYTVTGSGGGGTHMYHWNEPRALTNRERARIQTFPDDFVFVGPKESVRKQIGMAVPPQGARIIFRSILQTFEGIEYDWIKPSISDDTVELLKFG